MARVLGPGAARGLVVSFLLVLAARALALEPLGVDGTGGYSLAGHLALLRDPGRALDAAAAEARSAEFLPVRKTPNLGITSDAVWLRLALANSTADHRRIYVVFQYPVADSVILSVLRADGSVGSLQAGDSVRASPAVVPFRHFVFPVDLAPSESAVCLLRVQSTAAMSLPIRILEERELAAVNQRDSVGYGLVFGGLVLVVLYLLASQRREPWLGWFCTYILAFGLHVALRGGYVRAALGDQGCALANLINVVAIGLLYYTGAAFYRSFLGLKDRSRALDLIMAVLQYLGLAFIPLSMFPSFALIPVSILTNLVGPLFSVSLAAVLWLRRSPNAGLFALGWVVPHTVSVVDFLRIHALLPYTSAEQWMLPLSLGIALLCLSSAVVRRRGRDSALARVDALTGLANRRRFDEALREEWNRARRQSTSLALLMIDVDDFKRYNDTRGHRAGDQCLRAVAAVFSGHTRRAGDLAARYGGEEFAVLLPYTPQEGALCLAERIRSSVEGPDGRDEPGKPDRRSATVSIGVASRVPGRDDEPEGLVAEADAALYRAKQSGKNRVAS